MFWQKLCKSRILYGLDYCKMNLFIFCILLYISKTICKPTGLNESIVDKITNDCGFSNTFFLKTFLYVCRQSIPNSKEFKLEYDSSPLLCMTYAEINSKYCDLSRNQSLKNTSVNETRSYNSDTVTKVSVDLKNKYKTVDEFCNLTQSTFKNYKAEGWSKLFWDHVTTDRPTCQKLCGSFDENKVTSLCSVIVWAQTLYNKYSALADTNFSHQNQQKKPPDEIINEASAGNVDKIAENYYNIKQDENENGDNNPVNQQQKHAEVEGVQTPIKHGSPVINDKEANVQDKKEMTGNEREQKVVLESHDATEPVQSNVPVGHIMTIDNAIRHNDDMTKTVQETEGQFKPQDQEPPSPNDQELKGQDQNTDNVKASIENVDNVETMDKDDIANGEEEENPRNDDVGGEDGLGIPDVTNPIEEKNKQSNNDGFKGVEIKEDPVIIHNRSGDSEESHFYTYFLSMGFVCVIMYLLFHNKKKLVALAVEGRRGRTHSGSRRRPNTASYSKLDSNLEEAMVSNMSQASVTHVLY